jgi:hypothetical protein
MLLAPLLAFLTVLVPAPAEPTFIVPNFRDLTVKTREVRGFLFPIVTSWYFKGARERIEHRDEAAPPSAMVRSTILQCDQKLQFQLNPRDKEVLSSPIGSLIGLSESPQPFLTSARVGPMVTVTTDSVDTGERRQMGSYEVRHVRTTIRVVPAKGARTPASTKETDGWYIDLPGFGCRQSSEAGQGVLLGFTSISPAGPADHVVLKHLGTAPHGLAVEETITERSRGNVVTSKVKLVEFSEQPIDQSLFELPLDYSPAQFHNRRSLHVNVGPEPAKP